MFSFLCTFPCTHIHSYSYMHNGCVLAICSVVATEKYTTTRPLWILSQIVALYLFPYTFISISFCHSQVTHSVKASHKHTHMRTHIYVCMYVFTCVCIWIFKLHIHACHFRLMRELQLPVVVNSCHSHATICMQHVTGLRVAIIVHTRTNVCNIIWKNFSDMFLFIKN